MLPYFIKLPELKLSRECMDRITNYIMNDKLKMNDECIGQAFFERGNNMGNFLWDNDPELIAFQKRITLPGVHRPLLHNRPGSNSMMHVDAFPGRVSILYIPIYPEPASYDPLVFWEQGKDPEPTQVAVAADDGSPFVFNARKLHGVPFIHTHRINLQISFNEPIEEIFELVKHNKFFI